MQSRSSNALTEALLSGNDSRKGAEAARYLGGWQRGTPWRFKVAVKRVNVALHEPTDEKRS